VIIGKTNVPELTLWPWTASRTWQTTRNPWDLRRTPGGSSGGSAVAVCAGMAAMAVGSDGGGSVRYPAGLTGLVGVKPQRDRIPLGPEHGSGWHGLVALGPLTRSVRDAALFLDVTTATAGTSFRDALTRRRRLTIAIAANPPAGSHVTISAERRRQFDDAVDMLGGLGHEIVVTDIDYPIAGLWNSTVRLLKGAEHDVGSMPHRAELEPRTRSIARLGRMIPARSLRKALAREHEIAASINAVYEHVDVVATPLCESAAPMITTCPNRSAVRSLRAANTSAWLVPWNLTGQPAMSIPTGLDQHGLPTAIQLVGRPDDEATLLALAAHVEAHRPFPRVPRTAFGAQL
jgi:amidase